MASATVVEDDIRYLNPHQGQKSTKRKLSKKTPWGMKRESQFSNKQCKEMEIW